MKRIVYLLSILLIGAGSMMAQKSNVKLAKNRAMAIENPDFDGARQAIKLALEDPTTKDLTETWYVAAQIGYQQYQNMLQDRMLKGTEIDPIKAGEAVAESYDYLIKAAELSLIPNAKGKVDTKTHKNCVDKMLEYYTNQVLVSCGIQLNNERKDYKGAYEYFEKHLNIPYLEMMQDPKVLEKMPIDTNYYAYCSYQASFAVNAEMHDKAIAIYEKIKDTEYKPVAIREWLVMEYKEVKDTVNYVRTLNESIEKYPNEAYFIQVLINHYIYTGQVDEAILYLDKAIERNPNVANYYQIKGSIYTYLYENNGTNRDDAIATLKKAIDLDPNLADAQYNLGNIYFLQAEKVADKSSRISDNKQYDAAMKQVNEIFSMSLPYFETAHKLNPSDMNTLNRLRSLYYRLKMDDKYNEINAEIRAL